MNQQNIGPGTLQPPVPRSKRASDRRAARQIEAARAFFLDNQNRSFTMREVMAHLESRLHIKKPRIHLVTLEKEGLITIDRSGGRHNYRYSLSSHPRLDKLSRTAPTPVAHADPEFPVEMADLGRALSMLIKAAVEEGRRKQRTEIEEALRGHSNGHRGSAT